MAYRGLPRPSSAPDAKASTVCHYHLATTDNKMLAHTIHKSKHQPHTLTPRPPASRTHQRAPDPTKEEFLGAVRGKQTDHPPPVKETRWSRLLPQTPNSAPPNASRSLEAKSDYSSATPSQQNHPPRGGPECCRVHFRVRPTIGSVGLQKTP